MYNGTVYRDAFGGLTDPQGKPLKRVGDGFEYIGADEPTSDQGFAELGKQYEAVKAELNQARSELEAAKQRAADAEIQAGNLKAELFTKDEKLSGWQAELEPLKQRVADAEITLGSTKAALEGTLAYDQPGELPELVQLALQVKGQADPTKAAIPADALDRLVGIKGLGPALAKQALEALTK